ncbi:NADPH:quinone oxidoreductase family protein [Rhizobium alvei]|uniref:NADPH:quinone oxidoreductase family protein n=1 Tax=Rhizobium alvei TaxID=1132659 RepID=A0ABT8YIA1_9HYPH|nr:NADPH:quinone oxidoreductase family protein [Rhizobium alvei]MDO6962995.1 NADPH:quinone oxidoreductase family protein [Rhizobium alvei]
MKAILCKSYGPIAGLSLEEVADPAPGPNDVLVRAEAMGVNYPDGLIVQGLYQAKPELPFIPGFEMAGTIEAVGAEVKRLKVGDRVAYFASTGGYAELGIAPERNCIPLPAGMPADDACALLCAFGTSHHALRQRGRLKEGEILVVAGAAGATGLAAVQIGKALGATVIAIASSDDKRKVALEAGADHAIGYDNLRDELKALTGKRGIDVVFDPVGGDLFDTLVRLMGRYGRYLVVGFAAGRIPALPANLALVKEFDLVGVFWGSFTAHEPATYAANMQELFGWYQSGAVKPKIDGRHPLSDAVPVLERIMARGAVGKYVLHP